MLKSFVGVFAATAFATVIVGCGGAQSQFIKDFSVRFVNSDVTVTAEFSQAVPLNTELSVPLKDLGSIKLIPASAEKGFQIETTLNSRAWLEKELLKYRVNALPNGIAFPSFVSTDLALKNVSKSALFSTNLYLGTTLEKKYLGAGVELSFINEKFPASLTLTQKIVDANQREIGAVTLYGPKVVGGVTKVPGGLFFVTNVDLLRSAGQFAASKVTRRIPLIPYDGVDVSSPDANVQRELKKPSKLLQLLGLFNAEGRNSGVMD